MTSNESTGSWRPIPLCQAIRHVNGRTLWANLHLLFWLSLIPFVTSWMGENHFAAWPVAVYGEARNRLLPFGISRLGPPRPSKER